ncbi:MAG TPA: hypothetical protein DCZ49_08445 [Hyphomonadaceae bacterium]|nr:hypothetical protein [Hyphomonadaceae bacterium]
MLLHLILRHCDSLAHLRKMCGTILRALMTRKSVLKISSDVSSRSRNNVGRMTNGDEPKSTVRSRQNSSDVKKINVGRMTSGDEPKSAVRSR